ncbi:MAG: hypothetical protein K2H30_02905, partial [Clostridia bacterium]|nr:hypothetical protein [Clostridia bacterium]
NMQSSEARNNASAVIWLEFAGTSFLFTSDVSKSVLERLCNNYKNAVDYFDIGGHTVSLENCNVLQVPDHGSKNAVYAPFYDLVRPEVAVVSTDRADTTNGVYSDLLGCGCENIYSTDDYGTVTIEVTADGYAVV